MRRVVLALLVLGCGSSSPKPATSEQPPIAPVSPPDAAPAPPPDAGPPAAVTAAPAWVFKYTTADRKETWTLQHAEGHALLVVDTAKGAQRYLGTATEGATLSLAVSTGTAKLALDCKREKLAVSSKCNDTKAKPIEVLNCYHPDFKAPMPFAPAPGVEYLVDATCNGYRIPPAS